MIIISIIFFLLLSAFFSGSEIAFVSANKLGIEVMKNKKSRRGNILAKFYEKPSEFLGTMLVGNNIALVIFTILMTKLIKPSLVPIIGSDGAATLFSVTLIITAVVLLFGEFLPKTLFRLFSNDMLMALAYPLRFFKWMLAIPTWIMTVLSDALLKYILRQPTDQVENALTRVDLEHFINDKISEEEDIDKEILTNALNLRQTKVRDCMIPRTEIVHIEKTSSVEEVLAVFKSSRLSRVIITDGGIENAIGYVHHQQLLDNPKSIKKLVLPITYVPEAMNVQSLMYNFIKEESTIACVVDEFGGTAGLITLEDILEEIFGEIEDEHDIEDNIEHIINEDEYVFSGRLEIDYLNEKYETLNIPEGEYHTLSGYIVMTSGSIPEKNAKIQMDGFDFILEEVSDTKIEVVRLIKLYEVEEEGKL